MLVHAGVPVVHLWPTQGLSTYCYCKPWRFPAALTVKAYVCLCMEQDSSSGSARPGCVCVCVHACIYVADLAIARFLQRVDSVLWGQL